MFLLCSNLQHLADLLRKFISIDISFDSKFLLNFQCFYSILIIMFCTDGKISVRINLPLFSTVVPFNICMFLSCRPFVAITTFSTGLVGVEVTFEVQDRHIHILNGTTVENKGKLISTPSVPVLLGTELYVGKLVFLVICRYSEIPNFND